MSERDIYRTCVEQNERGLWDMWLYGFLLGEHETRPQAEYWLENILEWAKCYYDKKHTKDTSERLSREAEVERIGFAIVGNGGRLKAAAKELGMPRATLYDRLRMSQELRSMTEKARELLE
jgi:DNA-binding NtrC family response regulator